MSERKRERQEREQRELDEALAAWVEMQSRGNTHELYRKACAYLGIVVDEGKKRLELWRSVVEREAPSEREIEDYIRIAELDSALRNARRQLVMLGGDGSGDHGDKVQRAVLHQIDVALGDD